MCDGPNHRIRLLYRGVLVELDPYDLSGDTVPTIERTVERLLARQGWSAPPPPSPAPASAQPPRRPRAEPLYQPDGTPCCPAHRRALVEGRYGLYCPARAAEGEPADARGYCALKFSA